MADRMLRAGAFAALIAGLAACSSGTGDVPRASAPAGQGATNQSGAVQSGSSGGGMAQPGVMQGGSSGMGQMDRAQMMEHCRAMMQGGPSAHTGSMAGMDMNQMMEHCRSMMGQNQGGGSAPR